MIARPLGRTGLVVSALGLGAGPLGDRALADEAAARVVHTAIDHGITLIDTAPSYGASEERLGRALRGKRDAVVLCTKGGYGVAGTPDWTPDVIARGIEQALGRLATDRIDVFFLHSCNRERLARGDLTEPLVRAREAGKIRAIGYSGDGDALEHAIGSGTFDVVECSVNLADQRALERAIPEARARGIGVLGKRALANAAWLSSERPSRDDVAIYWERLLTLFEGAPQALPWDELAVRFASHAPGVASALVGTRSVDHLARAVEHESRGPLPASMTVELATRFRQHGRNWDGIV
ncbi:MAG: aldo/keto reductase [Myxococcaceae bacterium]|nr:aldo/keto reductase [Myxococcaceae bacterium]